MFFFWFIYEIKLNATKMLSLLIRRIIYMLCIILFGSYQSYQVEIEIKVFEENISFEQTISTK